MSRRIFPFLVAAAIAAPHAARAAVSVEAFYGLSRPRADSFSQAASGTADDPDVFASSLNVAGGSLILHLGAFEIGAIADHAWKSGSASQTAIGGLIGLGGDVGGWLRLELLGEIGGQKYGNFSDAVGNGSADDWLMYLGVRPGVAVRIPVGDATGPAILVGLWAFARWDLTTTTVPVTAGDVGNTPVGDLELGGTTIGAQLRLGLDF